MSDGRKIETDFVETVQKFFPPEQIKSISPGHGEINDNVISVSAVVTVKGNTIGLYDGKALLEAIGGELVEESDTLVLIKGTKPSQCRVTITCAGTAS